MDENKIGTGRLAIIIGLTSFLVGWAITGVYGFICLLKKYGWLA